MSDVPHDLNTNMLEVCSQCYGKSGFRVPIYLEGTCRDAPERSETNKLAWESCVLYSLSISIVFVSL